jgi:16S rRNA (cytosine967-C5)-methyltransferase
LRLHRSLVHAVADALRYVFEDNHKADKVVERILRSNPKWGARDRGFIAENTYDMVRHWRRITEAIDFPSPSYEQIFAVWWILNGRDLPDWPELKGVNRKNVLANDRENQKVRAIRESMPDWLDQLGETELGTKWDRELRALNEPAELVLRVNSLKANRNGVEYFFHDIDVNTSRVNGANDALILDKRVNVFRTDAFKNGWFEVQDASSQQVAPFVQVEPGMRVIDACAGGGGKSLHLAALMENKGKILALDTEEWKLKNLRARASRGGIDIIECRTIDNAKAIKRLNNTADRVLLDVPCSGLGVLKRNPDAKWKLTPEMLEEVIATQANILQDYSAMVKAGGKLVYATCSILPSENVDQVFKFLEKNPDFSLEEQQEIWPSEGFDGFFMARMVKKG